MLPSKTISFYSLLMPDVSPEFGISHWGLLLKPIQARQWSPVSHHSPVSNARRIARLFLPETLISKFPPIVCEGPLLVTCIIRKMHKPPIKTEIRYKHFIAEHMQRTKHLTNSCPNLRLKRTHSSCRALLLATQGRAVRM